LTGDVIESHEGTQSGQLVPLTETRAGHHPNCKSEAFPLEPTYSVIHTLSWLHEGFSFECIACKHKCTDLLKNSCIVLDIAPVSDVYSLYAMLRERDILEYKV
jgi:hypothetical protein